MLQASIPLAWKLLLSWTLPSLSTTAVTSSSSVTSAGEKPMTLMASWGWTLQLRAWGGLQDFLRGGVLSSRGYLHGVEVGCIVHAGQAGALPVQVSIVATVLAELQLLWLRGGEVAVQPRSPPQLLFHLPIPHTVGSGPTEQLW